MVTSNPGTVSLKFLWGKLAPKMVYFVLKKELLKLYWNGTLSDNDSIVYCFQLSTLGDKLKLSTSTQGLDTAGDNNGDDVPSQQYLAPDNVPNNTDHSPDENLPPIRIPVPASSVHPIPQENQNSSPRFEATTPDSEDEGVWERRRPKPVKGLPNAMGLSPLSESNAKKPRAKKSKPKLKNNKVDQENGGIV